MADGFHIKPDGYVTEEFSELMANVASGYPAAKITARGIKLYARAFGHVPLETMQKLFDRAVRERVHFPSIAELNSYLEASSDDAALIAWSSLQRAAEQAGAWASVEVQDGAAARALLDVFGSWPAFCQMDDGPSLAMKRQEFLAAYRHARRNPRRGGKLIGLCEAEGKPGPEGITWAYRLSLSGQVEPMRQRALPERKRPKELTK